MLGKRSCLYVLYEEYKMYRSKFLETTSVDLGWGSQRYITYSHYEYNKNIHLVFVDFRQAYDSIIRNKLWKNLTTLGIPNKIVNLIKLCNSNTKCVVRVQGELSDPFEVGKRLRQGDALSPVLFNLTLESVLKRMPRRQTMELNENHTLLAYAELRMI